MSEAPERIWVDVCEYVNLAPSWIDELRVAHKDSYVNDDLSGQQYIRADIHDARIEVLEVQLQAAMVALNTCHGALHRMRVKH